VTYTAASILDDMKDRDQYNVGVVTMLTTDPTEMLTRLCACWPNVAVCLDGDRNPDEECPPDTPANFRERWLWARIEPEPEPVWAEVAGLPSAPHVYRAMRTLQQIGAVFPDGTLSRSVVEFLQHTAKGVGVTVDEPPP